MEDNKALLEALLSLSIQGAKEELQRQIDRGEIELMLEELNKGD